MKLYKFMIYQLVMLAMLLHSVTVSSSEIRIDGDKVVITTDDGKMIDAANLPPFQEVREGKDAQVHENGISIGTATNNSSGQNNVRRSTTLDNVTIINNGKTTIYRKDIPDTNSPEKK